MLLLNLQWGCSDNTGWFYQSPDKQQAHRAAFHVTFHTEKNTPCQQTSTSSREESSKTEKWCHCVHQKAQTGTSLTLWQHRFIYTPLGSHISSLQSTKSELEQHHDAEERQDILKISSWSPLTATQAFQGRVQPPAKNLGAAFYLSKQ